MSASNEEELAMLRSTRSSLTAFHLLLRKLNEDLATMAENYRRLTAANKEWRQIADRAAGESAAANTTGKGAATETADPSPDQRHFLQTKLRTLFAAHRDGVVAVKSLMAELDKTRPGFVPHEQVTAVLDTMAQANAIVLAGDKIMEA